MEEVRILLQKRKARLQALQSQNFAQEQRKSFLRKEKEMQSKLWQSKQEEINILREKYQIKLEEVKEISCRIALQASNKKALFERKSCKDNFLFNKGELLTQYLATEKNFTFSFAEYLGRQFQAGLTKFLTSSALSLPVNTKIVESVVPSETILNNLSLLSSTSLEYNELAEEIERLQVADSLSWQVYIDAQVAYNQAFDMRSLCQKFHAQNDFYLALTESQVHQKISAIDQERNIDKSKEELLIQIRSLINDCAPLYLHDILNYDCKLKFQRQNYFLQQLQNSFQWVSNQNGRLKLLMIGLKREHKVLERRRSYLQNLDESWLSTGLTLCMRHEKLLRYFNNRKLEKVKTVPPTCGKFLSLLLTCLKCVQVLESGSTFSDIFEDHEDLDLPYQELNQSDFSNVSSDLELFKSSLQDMRVKLNSYGENYQKCKEKESFFLENINLVNTEILHSLQNCTENFDVKWPIINLSPPGFEDLLKKVELAIQQEARLLKQTGDAIKHGLKELSESKPEDKYEHTLWLDFLLNPRTMHQKFNNINNALEEKVQ